MLYSELIGAWLQNEVATTLGIVKEFVFDQTGGVIHALVASSGFRKPNQLFGLSIQKYDRFERMVIFKNESAPEPAPPHSSLGAVLGKDLMGMKVYSSDNKRVGKVYDFVIGTQLQQWTVWKLLIRVGVKKRRLRLALDDVAFKHGTVVLSLRADGCGM